MMFNQQGTRIYFGSDQGLMYLDVGSSSPSVTNVSAASTPCNVSLCGKVLAISPDGNRVVVSDTISNPHQVYIFNGGSSSTAPIDLVLSDPTESATAAAFSPDEMKLFILTDAGRMYVYSTVDGLTSFSVGTSATDLAFSADGSIAYVAGVPANGISGYGTCDFAGVGSLGLTAAPSKIFAAPNIVPTTTDSFVTQTVIALEPPDIQTFTTQFTQAPLAIGQLTCNPPTATFAHALSINLGQGNFSPLYMRVVSNGSAAVVVANLVPAVLFVDLIQQTTTPVPLANNGLPLAATASTDGSQVFVAACDVYTNNDPTKCTSGSVHIINRDSGGDIQQVPYVNFNTNNSMCTIASAPACFPDMIAIKAQ
jgi:DNA-binding beta-propeller fold protein YncE